MKALADRIRGGSHHSQSKSMNSYYCIKQGNKRMKQAVARSLHTPHVDVRKTPQPRQEDSHEYLKKVRHLFEDVFKHSRVSTKRVYLDNDGKLYRMKLDPSVDAEPSPYLTGTARREFTVEELSDMKPNFKFRPVIEAHMSGTTDFAVLKASGSNDHSCTSVLKRWLSCFIKDRNLNTVALDKSQTWLNNESANGSFYVIALNNTVLRKCLKEIAQAGVPCIAVVEDYVEGVHLGTAYSYVCHKGLVKGVSKGSNGMWTDENLPSEFQYMAGQLTDDYCFETVIVFGPQRIIYMHKGTSTSNDCFTPQTPTIPVPEAAKIVMNRSSAIKSFFARQEIVEVGSIPQQEMIHHTFVAPKVDWYMYQLAQTLVMLWFSPITYLCNIALYALYYFKGYEKIERYHLYDYIASLGRVGKVLSIVAKFIIAYTRREKMHIDLTYDKVYVKSELAEKFIGFMGSSARDKHELPFGFYHVDRWNIVRLPAQHPQVNYTNLIECVDRFNKSLGHSPNTIPAKFYRLFGHNNIDVANESAHVLTAPLESIVRKKMVVTPYSISLASKQHRDYLVHLTDMEQHSQYGMLENNIESLSASASNRLLQDIPEKLPMTHYLKWMVDFWNQYVRVEQVESQVVKDCDTDMEEYHREMNEIEEIPDLSKYSGRKLTRMINGYNAINTRPYYETFMKNESLPLESVFRKGTRIITPNTVAFNAENLNWYHKFEKILLSTMEPRSGTRIFAKGLNFDQRLDIIREKRKHFQYVFCCDFKNFDAHHRFESYAAELAFYEWLGLEHEKAQALYDAKHSGNIEHNMPCRCSGDLFTGSGNCLVIASLFKSFNNNIEIFCDGDDTLVFSNDKDDAQRICEYMESIGFELRVDAIVGPTSDGIEFCQMTYYTEEDCYTVNIDRRLGKSLNFTASSPEEMAKRIYGKIMSLVALKSVGVEMKGDLPKMQGLPVLDDREWWSAKYFKGCQKLKVENDVVIDFSDPMAGWFRKICHEINQLTELEAHQSKTPIQQRREILNLLVRESRKQCNAPTEVMDLIGSLNERCGSWFKEQVMARNHSPRMDILSGSTRFVNSTKTMKCIELGLLGNRPILQSLKDTLLDHTIRHPATVSACQVNIYSLNETPNKHQLDKAEASLTSHQQHSSKLHQEDHAEATNHGYSNSSIPSRQQAMEQSHSSWSTTSHSGSRNSCQSNKLKQARNHQQHQRKTKNTQDTCSHQMKDNQKASSSIQKEVSLNSHKKHSEESSSTQSCNSHKTVSPQQDSLYPRSSDQMPEQSQNQKEQCLMLDSHKERNSHTSSSQQQENTQPESSMSQTWSKTTIPTKEEQQSFQEELETQLHQSKQQTPSESFTTQFSQQETTDSTSQNSHQSNGQQSQSQHKKKMKQSKKVRRRWLY